MKQVGGGIAVKGNDQLHDIAGLEGVQSVGKDDSGNSLVVANNPALSNVAGLAGIVGAAPGAVHIANNTALQNLDGLSGIASVGADLSLIHI